MLAKRIIPCLDVKDGRVVKGVQFVNLRDAGDPVEQASIYDRLGADELVFLDISASPEGRQTTAEVVRKVADQVFMPLTIFLQQCLQVMCFGDGYRSGGGRRAAPVAVCVGAQAVVVVIAMKSHPIEGITGATFQDASQEVGFNATSIVGWVIWITIEQQAAYQNLCLRVSCFHRRVDSFEHLPISSYDRMIFSQKVDVTFQHFYELAQLGRGVAA